MPTFTVHLAAIMTRDLRAARREVEAYPDEDTLWRVPPGTSNCAGSLARHIAGNLHHFIGAILGSNGYVRDREAEFSQSPIPRSAVLDELDAAIAAVETVLPGVPAEVLDAPFPVTLGGHKVNTQDLLLHLAVHLCYHLGQIDYHRRLVTGLSETVGTQAVSEISSAEAVS